MFLFRQSVKSKAVLAVVLTMTLSGCWKASKKDDPHNGKSERDATASFFIKNIDCEAVTPKVTDEVWKVAKYKEVFARACVTDRKVSREVKGHKFTVEFPEEGNAKQTSLITDDEGCFQWREKLPYNPLAEAAGYVEVVRRIHGEGVHVGFRDVHLAINPWAGDRGTDRQKACKFLKSGQVSDSHKFGSAEAAKALSGGNQTSQLWMSDISTAIHLRDEKDEALRLEHAKLNEVRVAKNQPRLQALVDESGGLLEVNLTMKPQVRVTGLDGNPEYVDLKAGQFQVWVQLIAANVGDSRNSTLLLTPNLVPGEGKIVAGKLETNVKLGLSRRTTRGRLEMAIRVVPVGLESTVAPFESLYVLGDIDQLLSSSRPMLSPKVYQSEEKFQYDTYVTKADNFEELKASQQALKFDPFIFETATVMFAGVRPGETATTRVIEYKVQSCVRDTLTGRRVQHQKFQIFDENNKEILISKADGTLATPTTNQEGCLVWTSSLTHKYYLPERFYFPEFKIVYPHSGEEKAVKKQLVINPWDAMFRTFGFDRIEFPQEFINSVRDRTKIESRLFIPRFSYHAIRFRYEIDRFMELEVKKQILLNLRPEVLRYSGIIGGRKVSEPLRDGIYLMKVAIQKDYLDPVDKGLMLMPGKDGKGQKTTAMRRNREATPKHFVTVVKKLVRVNSGEINTPVEFAVQDLRMMRIRSQFMVQIEPVNEHLLLVARVLNDQDQKALEAKMGGRSISASEKQKLVSEFREKRQEVISKMKSKLADTETGLLNTDALAKLNEAQLAEFNLTTKLVENILSELKLNDFTVQQAAPVVDLDTLTETFEESGLKKRTFVGPMIFLSNAYSDDLRPTDNLDEDVCEISDCDEIKSREMDAKVVKNNYDTNKYFGSIKHLAQKTVDDMIREYQANKSEYPHYMKKLSSLQNFADLYNLDLVSMNDSPLGEDPLCQKTPRRCEGIENRQVKVGDLLKKLNHHEGEWASFNGPLESFLEGRIPRAMWSQYGLMQPVTQADLKSLAQGVKPTNGNLAERMCRVIALELKAHLGDKGRGDIAKKDFYRNCLISILSSGPNGNGLLVDHKLRVFETGEYVFKGGKQMNLNVGSSFSLNHSVNFGYSAGAGFEFFDLPGVVAHGLGGTIGSAIGSLAKFVKPLSAKLGVSVGASRQTSDGTSVSESTYLVMQSASFAIQLKEYEKCSVVRLDMKPMGMAVNMLANLSKTDQERALIAKTLNKGMMVCTGERESKPRPVRESYFYFTQHFTEGDMLDQADLYNHPWLLAMRGVRDFSNFAYLIRAQDAGIYFSPFDSNKPVVSKPGWPLDKMVEAYRQVLPTFPSLYTVLGKGEALEEFPFDQDAAEVFGHK